MILTYNEKKTFYTYKETMFELCNFLCYSLFKANTCNKKLYFSFQ